LIDDHASELHRFLAALIGPQDAADCLQETFVAALRTYRSLRSADNLRAWLYTIAQRKATDHVRRLARRPTASLDGVEPAAPPADLGADDGLWLEVRGLPPKQRAAVIHRFVFDLAYREVAERMGCSEAAARRSVHEGIAKLRRTVVAR
jgi:RNA polymerase sigma-70 factor (ECF subfamily)